MTDEIRKQEVSIFRGENDLTKKKQEDANIKNVKSEKFIYLGKNRVFEVKEPIRLKPKNNSPSL